LRPVDGFVNAGIEPDPDVPGYAADILDRVTIALQDAAHVTLQQSLDLIAADVKQGRANTLRPRQVQLNGY